MYRGLCRWSFHCHNWKNNQSLCLFPYLFCIPYLPWLPYAPLHLESNWVPPSLCDFFPLFWLRNSLGVTFSWSTITPIIILDFIKLFSFFNNCSTGQRTLHQFLSNVLHLVILVHHHLWPLQHGTGLCLHYMLHNHVCTLITFSSFCTCLWCTFQSLSSSRWLSVACLCLPPSCQTFLWLWWQRHCVCTTKTSTSYCTYFWCTIQSLRHSRWLSVALLLSSSFL